MRRPLSLLLVCFLAAGLAATSWAADYDRYERGEPRGEYQPPPPRGAYAPPPRHAMYGQPYMNIQLGLFEPNDASDGLFGYDTGSNFAIAFGSRVSPVFAFEGTFGAYGADKGNDEVRVVPLTIGGRLVIPNPFIEPYFTGGFGFYFSHLEEDSRPIGTAYRGILNYSGVDDSDASFGGYVGGGLDAWLSNRVALNFEGKYHIVKPTYTTNQGNDLSVNVGGWAVNLGVRITFGGGAY